MLLSRGPSLNDTTFLHTAIGISNTSWMARQEGHRGSPTHAKGVPLCRVATVPLQWQ